MAAEVQEALPQAQGHEEFDAPFRAAQIVSLSVHGVSEHFQASEEETSADIQNLSPRVQRAVFVAWCLIPSNTSTQSVIELPTSTPS
jgi:hypothetical protein